MKVFLISEPFKSAVIDKAKPTPSPGEVLLQVRRVGFCGTDLSAFRGVNPLVSYPRVPGHEVGATIVELGPDVPEQFSVGQDVLVLPYTACGKCSACLRGRENCCRNNQTLGVQREGAMAEFVTSPWEKLLRSRQLSLPELALVEPITIGFHAISRGQVSSEDTVCVLGCGPIGLGAIAGAAARGARIVAVDIDDRKLALAAKCGASHAINSSAASLHDRLQGLTGERGPDVVVEAIGLPQTFQAAVMEVAFAGRVVYIGYAKAPVEYETKYFVMKELDILGSRNALPKDFKNVIQHLKSGKFPVDEVISHTAPLAQAGELLAQWSDQPEKFTKIQIQFDWAY